MNIKIVVACDKYKGNLSAVKVCDIIRDSILSVDPKIDVIAVPMADGGEGTVETMVEGLSGRYICHKVKGPLREEVEARFGLINNGNTAVIEMSSASGLWLVPSGRENPLETTTYGTGELIKKAIELGSKKLIIGIGGSATNDAGMGMAQALGARFYDENGELLGYGGKQLERIDSIDMRGFFKPAQNTKVLVACDVTNPLYGKEGAAYVYAPQKGADKKIVERLDRGLRNFARVVKKDLGKDISKKKGAGAAGGLGAGLVAFLGASLKPGSDIIIAATKFKEKIKDADLVITGEGAMDNQTYFGKSSYGVAAAAAKSGVPVITLNGSTDIDYSCLDSEQKRLFAGNFDILTRILSLEDAISRSKKDLYFMAGEIIRFYLEAVKNFRSKKAK